MARKRTKPVAEHIESQQPSADSTAPDQSTPSSVPDEPDIFDQVIAARAEDRFELPANTPAPREEAVDEKTPEPAPSPVLPKISDKLPNPRSIDQISLEAGDQRGSQMRLLRFRHHHGNGQDVWIQFDKKPGKEITDPIKAAGFRWEPRAEVGDHLGAWVKPLESGREIRTMLDAERQFKDLGNQIRKSNGLEPVGQVGVGAD